MIESIGQAVERFFPAAAACAHVKLRRVGDVDGHALVSDDVSGHGC